MRYRQKYPTVWLCDKNAGYNSKYNFVNEIWLVSIIFPWSHYLNQSWPSSATHTCGTSRRRVDIALPIYALVIFFPLYSQYIPHGANVLQMFCNRFRWNIVPQHYNDVIMGAIASQITSLTIVCSAIYSMRTSKKTQKFRVTDLCAGNSPVTGEFPAQRAGDTENVSIGWRHHDSITPIG